MSFLCYTLLAAGSLPAFILGAPLPTIPFTRIGTIFSSDSAFIHSSNKRAIDVYRTYSGTGQSSWPDTTQWISSFDDMFDANKNILKGGCTQFGVTANSDKENSDIYTGINQVAGETGVDARFILAVMLQESNGCVRAPTTNYGVRNPGLMQDHDGAATCNENGNIQNPCPTNIIVQMIRDGVAGTPAGDGLVQTLKQAPGSGVAKYYGAARIYNSGSIDPSGNLEKGIATHCYVSDVANRLTGWVYASKACSFDGAAVAASSPAPAPAAISAPPATPASPATNISPNLAQPAAVKVPATNTATKAVSNKMAPGVTTSCGQYYNVQDGDFCIKLSQKFGISLDQLRQLNTQIDAGCSNLWKGYDYCVQGL